MPLAIRPKYNRANYEAKAKANNEATWQERDREINESLIWGVASAVLAINSLHYLMNVTQDFTYGKASLAILGFGAWSYCASQSKKENSQANEMIYQALESFSSEDVDFEKIQKIVSGRYDSVDTNYCVEDASDKAIQGLLALAVLSASKYPSDEENEALARIFNKFSLKPSLLNNWRHSHGSDQFLASKISEQLEIVDDNLQSFVSTDSQILPDKKDQHTMWRNLQNSQKLMQQLSHNQYGWLSTFQNSIDAVKDNVARTFCPSRS